MLASLFVTLNLLAQLNRKPANLQAQAHNFGQYTLASHKLPLNDRQPNPWVNSVFKENILLNMAYMENRPINPVAINWQDIDAQSHYEFRLEPGQTFAFHDAVLPEFQGKIFKTSNAHFDYSEGFRSDGYLAGDGVCHLASLLNWVARDAGLSVLAPTNHDFANIPDIPRQYGVAIFSKPGNQYESSRENLYITNNRTRPITFIFNYQNDDLTLSLTD